MSDAEEVDSEVAPLVKRSRELCGCYSCRGGPREIGGHTIASPDKPRSTPSSCLAGEIFGVLVTIEANASPPPEAATRSSKEGPSAMSRAFAYAIVSIALYFLVKGLI